MIEAKIIADSIHEQTETRLTTFEVAFPRWILSEFNTHRQLSRNSASSRAIPIQANIDNILNNTAIPVSWGKNQAGMVADVDVDENASRLAEAIWIEARNNAIKSAQQLSELGIHKQIANRLIENFTYQKVIVTATEFDNFFWLRKHCYSDDTQALTKSGWKYIKDIHVGEEMYSLNPLTLVPEISYVTNTISWKSDGKAVSVSGKSTDLVVSDKHKLAVYNNNNVELVEAKSLIGKRIHTVKGNLPINNNDDKKTFFINSSSYIQSNQHKIIKEVELVGREVNLNQFMYFIGFYLGNGYSSNCNGNYNIYLCTGGNYADNIIQKIVQCMKELTPNSVRCYTKDSVKIVEISDKLLYNYIENFGISTNKQIPSYVWDMNNQALMRLYDGMMDSDSNWLSTKDSIKYSTSSKYLADDMQRLCMLIGKCATITTVNRIGKRSSGIDSVGKSYNIETKNLNYSVSISDNISQHLKMDAVKEINYDGQFVCVTVNNNNIIYVRRNGKSIWSGNCDAQPEIRVLAEKMFEVYKNNDPYKLKSGEWHTPYFENGYWKPCNSINLNDALKVSASCCGQVSYRKNDDSLEKAYKVFDMLNLENDSDDVRKHASPVEHQATPIDYNIQYGYDIADFGITHEDSNNNYWSGNLKDFIQYRQLITNESCKKHPYPL